MVVVVVTTTVTVTVTKRERDDVVVDDDNARKPMAQSQQREQSLGADVYCHASSEFSPVTVVRQTRRGS